MLGPNNYLGRAWQTAPIGITVEGANIMTRSLLIFGQGAILSHPWVMKEMQAAGDPDRVAGLRRFDHALWLHRPFRADEWLLYAQDSPNLHGSRGLARGLIFTRDGTLVASVAQEGLVRQRRQP